MAHTESTTGEIVNLMSVDAQRVGDILPYINFIWSSPLEISLALYFLYQTLGVSVFAGVAIMVLLAPLNVVVGKQVEKLQVKQMKFKDERVKAIHEVLSGIKVRPPVYMANKLQLQKLILTFNFLGVEVICLGSTF